MRNAPVVAPVEIKCNFKVEFFRCCSESMALYGRSWNIYAPGGDKTPQMVPWGVTWGWGKGRKIYFLIP
jgi:hypothetical protein